MVDEFADLGPDFHQNIVLNGKEYAHTAHGYQVNIYPSKLSSSGEVDSGSSKVKITTITNQNWERLRHHGKIVASNNQYLSYVLESRSGYVMRLIQPSTNSRTLLKGFVGAIVDVAFCHAGSNLLACVDEGGNLYLWDLDRTKDVSKTQTDCLKLVVQRNSEPDNLEHRLVWSPYVPPSEEEEEQEICNIILTHGNDIEVLDIHELFSTYASGMKVPQDKLTCGRFSIPEAHENSIHDLSLSPDGAVLATVGKDGHLKFWEVSWEKDEEKQPPKCLHDFVPHQGAAVTRLIFCDNHLSQDPGNQYWRFLITAANNNTEVKIWCAVNWKCLQTIKFLPPEPHSQSDVVEPHIQLDLDLSASYLVVADSNRKAVLILQMFSSPKLGDASVTSVTEYLLTQPVLSFTVLSVSGVRTDTDNGDSSEGESEEEEAVAAFDSRRNAVLLKLHCVHTRSMQELLVRFEPPDVSGVPPNGSEVPPYVPPSISEVPPNSSEAPPELSATPNVTQLPPDASSPPDLSRQPPDLSGQPPDLSGQPATNAPSDVEVPVGGGGAAGHGLDIATPILAHDTNNSLPTHVSPKPASLPSSLMDTQHFEDTPNTTFHSLPSFSPSPKLLTPSEFKSPAKGELEFVSQPPLLSPASIVASIASSQQHADSTATSMLADVSTTPRVSSEQDLTLTSVTLNSEPDVPSPPQGGAQESSEDEEAKDESGVAGEQEHRVMEIGGDEVKHETLPSEGVVEESALNPQLSPEPPDEEEAPSASESQKAFDSIMELLHVEKSAAAATPPQKEATFEEFTELLKNPDKLREQEREYEGQNQEEDVPAVPKEDPPLGEAADPEAVTSTLASSTSSFPDVVRPATYQDPPLTVSQEDVETQHREVAPASMPETQWPDIGAAQGPSPLAEKVSMSDNTEAERTGPQQVQSEVYIADSEPPDIGLLMPSALTDIPLEVPTLAPDLLEQEASADNRSNGEVGVREEGPGKVKSKPRKRTKRKKQSAGVVTMGVAEVMDPQSHSDSDAVHAKAAAVDLLPNVETEASVTPKPSAERDLLITELMKLVSDQQQMLCDLKSEQQRQFLSLEERIGEMRTSVLEEQRIMLSEIKLEQQQRLDRVLKDKQTLDKQKQDKLITALSNTLNTAVNAKLDKVVKLEMKNNVLPSIQQSLSSLHQELSGALSRSLAATDAAVRDGVSQKINSKELAHSVGAAMKTSLQQTLPAMFEEVFKTLVLSSFERLCQEMFKQVDQTFQRGTMEYLSQLQQQQQQTQDSALQYLLSSVDSMQSVLAKSMEYSAPTQLQSLIQQEVGTLTQQDVLTEVVTEVVQKEVGLVMGSQKSQQTEHTKEQVGKFIQAQNYNSAFELTLSTSDLQLVTYVCQQVDPEELFDKSPCPLTQPVLLSLIQQLSVNLEDRLELKLKYLDQCLLALDSKDEVTKKHMVPVITQLTKQMSLIQLKVQKDPSMATAGVTKQIRRLLLCAQQLCN